MPISLRELLQPHGLCNDIIRLITNYVEATQTLPLINASFCYGTDFIEYTPAYKNPEGITFDCRCDDGVPYDCEHKCSYYYRYPSVVNSIFTNIKIDYVINTYRVM